MQTTITIAILVLACGYACRQGYLLLHGDKGPCDECQLKKNCKKFGQFK